MKRAFVLMETFAVTTIVLLTAMFLAELLISSCKVAQTAKANYAMQKAKSEAINALCYDYTITLPTDYKTEEIEQTYTRKIKITHKDRITGRQGKCDVVWEK